MKIKLTHRFFTYEVSKDNNSEICHVARCKFMSNNGVITHGIIIINIATPKPVLTYHTNMEYIHIAAENSIKKWVGQNAGIVGMKTKEEVLEVIRKRFPDRIDLFI